MGIYVHIPFCRSKCFYCGFYSVASDAFRNNYADALCREIDLRKNYLSSNHADTLYFGGGTPSFMNLNDISKIVDKLHIVYRIADDAEITMEMNPEDMNREKLIGLKSLNFNRLSIGVQSFNDKLLKSINRTHSGNAAIAAIEMADNMGFNNIGIDLIIGLPGSTMADIENDMNIVNRLPISHISVYILSVDSNSVFHTLQKNGKFQLEPEDVSAEKYMFISGRLKEMGFIHYEISNFARDGKYSRHNTSYWQQKEYIGLGPSAHSYNLVSRQWNISNIKTYIDSLNNNILKFDCEELTENDNYNEYIMTALRTMWGADLSFLEKKHPVLWAEGLPVMEKYIRDGYARIVDNQFVLNEKGWLISDKIISDIFVTD